MLVCRSAITRGREEVVLGNNADRAGMSGRRRHETKYCIDEAPVAVEEGRASVDEMLQQKCWTDCVDANCFLHAIMVCSLGMCSEGTVRMVSRTEVGR